MYTNLFVSSETFHCLSQNGGIFIWIKWIGWVDSWFTLRIKYKLIYLHKWHHEHACVTHVLGKINIKFIVLDLPTIYTFLTFPSRKLSRTFFHSSFFLDGKTDFLEKPIFVDPSLIMFDKLWILITCFYRSITHRC